MHYRSLVPGEYLAAVELEGKEPTLTIASIKKVQLEQEDGKVKERGVIMFTETTRGLVVNRTNVELLAAMFGPSVEAWIGKRVTLKAEAVRLGPASTVGIRVKGSPELKGPVAVKIKLPRRKEQSVTLVPTGTQP